VGNALNHCGQLLSGMGLVPLVSNLTSTPRIRNLLDYKVLCFCKDAVAPGISSSTELGTAGTGNALS
jgi:hypothetical protein